MKYCVIKKIYEKHGGNNEFDLVGYLPDLHDFPLLVRNISLRECGKSKKYVEILNKNELNSKKDGFYLLFSNKWRQATLYQKSTQVIKGYIYNSYIPKNNKIVTWYITDIDKDELKNNLYLLNDLKKINK